MADPEYPPGSRAIKIPLSRMKNNNYATPPRRRAHRDDRMQRTDSTEGTGSGSGSGSDVGSSSVSSRARDTMLFNTSQTIASPANLQRPSATTLSTPNHSQPSQRKDKHRASDLPPPNSVPAKAMQPSFSYSSPLSPSMLSSSSYKSINLNSHMSDPDEPPRLITYTKHSQGFTWNDELFLPSYLVGRRYRGSKARRRWGSGYGDDEEMDDDQPFDEEADRCPVTDIFVTDEEAAAMLP